ncbi:hypothetical protein ABI59_16545 [Acidobacteria bacterium Mor1]|nr:hypothetical protein ABI59_16545 [Acidobacteria bacterium Mor1]
MCVYIHLLLEDSSDHAEASVLLGSYDKQLEAVENHRLRRQLGAFSPFLTTRKFCDCGTAVGHLARDEDTAPYTEQDMRRMKRKGWTATKIERWKQEKERHWGRDHLQVVAELESWEQLLKALLRSEARIGLLLHEYRGFIAEESFRVQRTVESPADGIDARRLAELELDVVYAWSRRPWAA